MDYEAVDINIAEISVASNRRAIDEKAVREIAQSLEKGPLQSPIIVRRNKDGENPGYTLVTGHHRLKAFEVLKRSSIPAFVRDLSDDDARKTELEENIFRRELSASDRIEHFKLWLKLAGYEPGQPAQVSKGGRGLEGGKSKLARDHGVSRREVDRLSKAANVHPAAIEHAKATGKDNMTVFAAAGSKAVTEQQIKAIDEHGEKKSHTPISPVQAMELAKADWLKDMTARFKSADESWVAELLDIVTTKAAA